MTPSLGQCSALWARVQLHVHAKAEDWGKPNGMRFAHNPSLTLIHRRPLRTSQSGFP